MGAWLTGTYQSWGSFNFLGMARGEAVTMEVDGGEVCETFGQHVRLSMVNLAQRVQVPPEDGFWGVKRGLS